MSNRQRIAMLHLARCASYLTSDHPLDADVARRRRDLIQAAFIGYSLSATGSGMRLNQLKLTRAKKWRSVEQPKSPQIPSVVRAPGRCVLRRDKGYLHGGYLRRASASRRPTDLDELRKVAAVVKRRSDRGPVSRETIGGDLEVAARGVPNAFDEGIGGSVSV